MKILYISHGPNLDGGAEKVLMRTISSLDHTKYEPVVIVPGKGEFSDWLESVGIKYYVIFQAWMVFRNANRFILLINFLLNLGPIKKIRKLIRSENINLVYSNTVVIFAGGIAAKLEGVPHLWHIHENIFNNPSFDFGFGKNYLRSIIDVLSEKIVTVSQATADKLSLEYYEGKLSVIQNSLPESAWLLPEFSEVQTLRNGFKIPTKAKILIFLGSLSACKKAENAVETLIHLNNKDVYLLLVGGGGEPEVERRIKYLISKNGLKDHVIITGYRKDVSQLLGLANISLVPSCNEAWGLATVEAMAAGLPVIAGNGGANPEIIIHEETGYLVEQGEPKLMAKYVEKLLSNPELCSKIGNAAREASREYTETRYLAKITKTIENASVANVVSKDYKTLLREIINGAKKNKRLS